jgi:SAM-dependent methyltransferase
MIVPGWRVLDVGSGDRPFPRATVLVDWLPRERRTSGGITPENPTGSIRRHGKPFVAGDLEALPFADNAFDFVYASHVIEHVADPPLAIAELERVAPRGYIECPRSWMEFVDASPFHRWLVDFAGGELQFRPKTPAEAAFTLGRRLFDINPGLFSRLYGQVFTGIDAGGTSVEKSLCHICAYWERPIAYRILPASVYAGPQEGP